MVIIVTITNNGADTLDSLTVQASLPELMQRREYREDRIRPGGSETFEFRFYLPEYLESDYTYLRVNVDSSDYKRKIYREIMLPTQ